uniref:Putative ovule protein n=1 Tax=Solanum chacoense TaxID=4108 RepID=A0A0V0H3Z2_SOLCH
MFSFQTSYYFRWSLGCLEAHDIRDVRPFVTKLDPKVLKCVFLGYSCLQKIYRCYSTEFWQISSVNRCIIFRDYTILLYTSYFYNSGRGRRVVSLSGYSLIQKKRFSIDSEQSKGVVPLSLSSSIEHSTFAPSLSARWPIVQVY